MTMLHLVTCPKAYAKLQAEIDAAAHQRQISLPIKDEEAKKLPYLQACIKEGLRMWPPVTGLISKEAPKGGDSIHGQFIPAGTKVAYCAWGVFRNKEIWGDDAVVFRPERWLEAGESELKVMESTAELLFAPGRWQCLGKSIALMELNKVFVEVCEFFSCAGLWNVNHGNSFCVILNSLWLIL
jgi:cytochrome P450